VDVVSAGVHGAVGGGVGCPGGLGHRQRVELGAQEHRGSLGWSDASDASGVGEAFHRDAQGVLDRGGGVLFVAGEAGLGVQSVPQGDGVGQLGVER
jgi:hypothetical protein